MNWGRKENDYFFGNGDVGILLAHSYLNISASENKEFAEKLLEELKNRYEIGVLMLRIVLPGHEQKSLEHLEKFQLNDYRSHFANGVEYLKKRGCKKIILIGQSLGALLSLDYYFRNPNDIYAMVLISTPFSSFNELNRGVTQKYFHFQARKLFDSLIDFLRFAEVEKSRGKTIKRSENFFDLALVSHLNEIFELEEILKQHLLQQMVNIPNMPIYSRNDPLYHHAPLSSLNEWLSSDFSRVVDLPGNDHIITLSNHQNLIVHDISNFLNDYITGRIRHPRKG